jgi:hypothetical protein
MRISQGLSNGIANSYVEEKKEENFQQSRATRAAGSGREETLIKRRGEAGGWRWTDVTSFRVDKAQQLERLPLWETMHSSTAWHDLWKCCGLCDAEMLV